MNKKQTKYLGIITLVLTSLIVIMIIGIDLYRIKNNLKSEITKEECDEYNVINVYCPLVDSMIYLNNTNDTCFFTSMGILKENCKQVPVDEIIWDYTIICDTEKIYIGGSLEEKYCNYNEREVEGGKVISIKIPKKTLDRNWLEENAECLSYCKKRIFRKQMICPADEKTMIKGNYKCSKYKYKDYTIKII